LLSCRQTSLPPPWPGRRQGKRHTKIALTHLPVTTIVTLYGDGAIGEFTDLLERVPKAANGRQLKIAVKVTTDKTATKVFTFKIR
jgi:hypothetical protein